MAEITAKQASAHDETTLSKNREANWPAVLFFIHIHLLAAYGSWLILSDAKLLTLALFVNLSLLATLGVTAGAHRLWAHHTYKANTPLEIALMICQTLIGQGSIYEWVRFHRLHHSQLGTDGDPYDHNKGFLHAHVLTRLRKLSEYQEKLLSEIDMSDLENDSVVMFQKRFYWILYAIFFLLLPINAPLEYWNDSVLSAIFIIGFLRYLVVLHASWLVDSAICVWGLNPNDKYPAETNVMFFITKNFWPQYHYLIPQDYKSGEYGNYDSGCTTALIRVWAALGWASDLQTSEPRTVQSALAAATKTSQPFVECLRSSLKEQRLPEDHYLHNK